ncbi:MAG: IS4 family transposase [Chroococcidiopsidaceae cyanobacterium CP_BM_ER_R8_30]|nr:IS4 family transposase [Chroococcidiopsidaceae cyanobacterium CP_BM_ER_R8_30]
MNRDDFENLTAWATQQWGQAKLGDARRNTRAIRLGSAIAAEPEASLPTQTHAWSELKAAYRLLNEQDVTHLRLSEPHWQATRAQAVQPHQQAVLFVQDTSELDFSAHRATKGLGHIGDTKGRGFLLHSCLAISPQAENPEVFGLVAQQVWTRQQVYKGKETRTQRRHRRSECDVWAEIVEAIGPAPSPNSGTIWVSVGDRGSDVFSYLRRSRALGWHCLVRICQDRSIQTTTGESGKLKQWARTLLPQAQKALVLRGRDGLPKRTVQLQVAWAQVSLSPPRHGPEHKQSTVTGWVIRCWEASPRTDALEWILFSTVPVDQTQSALAQVD